MESARRLYRSLEAAPCERQEGYQDASLGAGNSLSLFMKLREIDAVVCDLIEVCPQDLVPLELNDGNDPLPEKDAVQPQPSAPKVVLQYYVFVITEVRRGQRPLQKRDHSNLVVQMFLQKAHTGFPFLLLLWLDVEALFYGGT